MKIAVIICEYNPLQKGHVYHIQNTKKNCMCDKLVCIMSGNFVQRGEGAIADKYIRAKWAVQNGADLVIELPPEYVLSTAKYFALGAIKTADTINAEIILSFGSEDGDVENLKKSAEWQESEEFKSLIDEFLKNGYGYAQSYSLALNKLSPDNAELLSSPNNILGIEYIKAILDTKSSITPYTIKRLGEYKDNEPSNGFASASAIRNLLFKGDYDKISELVPYSVFEDIKKLSLSKILQSKDKLFSVLKYNMDKKKALNCHGVKEGIENRIFELLQSSDSYDELMTRLATKRYTNAYLMRTILNIVLGNNFTAEDLRAKDIDFVNILAIEEGAKDLLSLFKCKVISKSSDIKSNSLISRCDNLYSSIYTLPTQKGMQIIKNKTK